MVTPRLFEKGNASQKSKPMIVLDMANNHNGSVDHGLKIIQDLKNKLFPLYTLG